MVLSRVRLEMLRFLLRSTGFVVLAGAFAALIVDGTRSIAAQQVLQFSLQETLHWLSPATSAVVAARPVLPLVLGIPTWAAMAVVGSLLMLAGRRPPPTIGYSGRT